MDRILLPEIPLRARVGVGEAERAQEQDIVLHVELALDLTAAAKSDDLARTVDYDAVCDLLGSVVRARPYRLIEAIAGSCADAVLARFAVDEVRVQVRKPGALSARGVPYAGVEIVRRHA